MGKWLVLFSLSLFLIACADEKTEVVQTSGDCPTCSGKAEEIYCSTTTSYSGATVTISGAARYQARQIVASGLGAAGTAKPIRHAEVMVSTSSGSKIQCATTDEGGTYSFIVPQGSGSHTVKVNSRAFNNFLKASVLDHPSTNEYYSLSTSFVPNSSQVLGTLTATVTGDILGGPFNILDQFLEANDYLRAQVSTVSSVYAGADDFTVAPKVSAYWVKGFNPGTYYDSAAGGLSFYVPGYSRLFILGGDGGMDTLETRTGDTDSSDTDHFDNSVIIHEYGHFLEDVMFQSDSPGGSHNGNKIIDPRLAWSEGWGNFIQAAVQDHGAYIDTLGNIDGVTSFAFAVTLETATTDIPALAGEGNFREFSVTRILWDAIDGNADSANSANDNVSGGFPEIWASLTKAVQGWMNSDVAFRNIGVLHLAQTSLSSTDWTDIRTMENQRDDARDYAQFVSTAVTCANMGRTITPRYEAGDSDPSAKLTYNNDFFHYKHASTGNATFTLQYTSTPTQTADLDLLIYNESARLTNSADLVGTSRQSLTSTMCSSVVTITETVTVSNLPAGNYLIRIGLFPGYSSSPTGYPSGCRPNSGSFWPATSYHIRLNGANLCNDSIF